MNLDMTIANNLERLKAVKNVTINDVCRVYFLIKENKQNELENFSFDGEQKGRNFYITDKGIEHTFTTRKAAYVYLMTTYGTFTQ